MAATLISATIAIGAAGAQPDGRAVLAPQDRLALTGAFTAAEAGLWDEARAMARAIEDPIMRAVFDWADYVMGDPDGHRFEPIAEHALAFADWPNRAAVIRAGEAALARALEGGDRVPPASGIAAFFDIEPPHTFDGVMAYAAALTALGRTADRDSLVRDRWPEMPLTEDQETTLLRRYGQALDPRSHDDRLDRLLWEGRLDEAERQLSRVAEEHRRLGEARLRLQRRQSGVDAAIDAVPASLRSDEGLLFDRLRWRWRAGLVDGAMALLADQPSAAEHPRAWWNQRDAIARALHRAGRVTDAYAVARSHGYADGYPFAVGEWFAGWMALRHLDDPQTALGHLDRKSVV